MQRIRIRCVARANVIDSMELRQARQRIIQGLAPFLVVLRLLHVYGRRRRLPRNAAEIFLHLRQRFFRIKITGQHHHHVIGRVVNAEEVFYVVQRGGIQVVHGADHRMVVGKIVIRHGFQLFKRFAIGLVIHPQTALFLHCIALVIQVGLRNIQCLHPVRFQEQCHIQLVLRQLFEIIGLVVVSASVQGAAIVLDQQHVLAFAHVGGAFKHHVLEEMGEPGASLLLIARAGIVGERDGEHGRGMLGSDDDSQPVIQRGIREFHFGKS